MAGKVQAGRNMKCLTAMHGAIADMMAEAGYTCNGQPLNEAAILAMSTAVELVDARHLVAEALRASNVRRSAVQQAIKAALKANQQVTSSSLVVGFHFKRCLPDPREGGVFRCWAGLRFSRREEDLRRQPERHVKHSERMMA